MIKVIDGIAYKKVELKSLKTEELIGIISQLQDAIEIQEKHYEGIIDDLKDELRRSKPLFPDTHPFKPEPYVSPEPYKITFGSTEPEYNLSSDSTKIIDDKTMPF